MNSQLYEMAVRITLQTAGLNTAVASALGLFTRLQQQAALTGGATAQLSQALRGVGLLAVGTALTGLGLAGISVMRGWTSAASDLQQAMTGVGLATVGTAKQLAALQALSFTTAAQTMFSAPQIADMARLAGTAGLNSRKMLLAALPSLAAGAELDYRLKGVSYQQSVPAMVAIAEQFHARTAGQFESLFNLVGRADVVSRLTPNQMSNALARIAPAIASFNIGAKDAISLVALASNLGLAGGAGGTSRLMAMFRGLVPTLSGRGLHNQALARLQQLGVGQFFTAGSFAGVTPMLESVMRAMSKIHDQAKRLAVIQTVFQTAGGSALEVLANPASIARFKEIQNLLGPNGLASTQTMRNTFLNTWAGQTTALKTNLQSISALFGQQLLPYLTQFVKVLVQASAAVLGFLQTHPVLTKFIAIFTAVTTAAALIVGPILIAAGAFSILSAAGLTAGLTLSPFLLIIGAVAGAIAGITLVIMNWSKVTQAAGNYFTWLRTNVTFLNPFLSNLGQLLAPVVILFQHWGEYTQVLGTMFGYLGTEVGSFAKTLDQVIARIPKLPPWLSGLLPGIESSFFKGLVGMNPALGAIVGAASALPTVPVVPHPRQTPGRAPALPGPHPRGPLGGTPIPRPIHLTVHNHFNGADHQTQEHLAAKVGEKVQEHISKALKDSHLYGGLMPAGLEPDLWGAM